MCVDTSGKKYVMKECRGEEEMVFTQVIPKIKSLNLKFKVLEFPDYKKIIIKKHGEGESQQEFRLILINFYEGKFFNKSWNEFYPESLGGRGVDDQLSIKSVALIEDFSLIDPEKLSGFNLLEFDFERWKVRNLPLMEKGLLDKQVLSKDQIEQVKVLLSVPNLFSNSKKVLTNGDFYPRNFSKLPCGRDHRALKSRIQLKQFQLLEIFISPLVSDVGFNHRFVSFT